MQHVKKASAGLASVLLAMLATGCATTSETIYVYPECTPAPQPMVDIDRGELWDALGEDPEWFWRVDGAFDRLIDWGLENQAVLERVCDPPQQD